ncbi:MAG: putative Ig domain-containing protein [Verrucomicrobiota bacterium]|jgi:hypothetical protein
MKIPQLFPAIAVATALALAGTPAAQASIAYGSINNFDTVNDTGVPCHGFQIELDDVHSADITYTYDWNHYGTPKITEDAVFISGAWHTNVHVRYEAVWTNTGWSAYTAVPAGPIPPTQGHQFTNPGTNFGGEHFGVGFRVQPSAVKYNWLQDDGAHNLALGPSVSVSTPTFVYIPAVPAVAPAQIQAAIVPPPAPIILEFGDATWVKEIRTTSHTNTEVQLRDLVDPDPNNPNAKDWRNGEPDEVEVEWQILQIDTGAAGGGANGQLVAGAQNLGNQGDDVVTRRYEFYEYLGPLDPQTGEALAQTVAADGTNGTGTYSNTVVVGKYLGAQMSAVEIASPLGLIDHLLDGEVNTPYPTRSVVIAGDTNFTATSSGTLPDGMVFEAATGQVSGTPLNSGTFVFTVSVSSSNSPVVRKNYPFMIAPAGVVLPPHSSVDLGVSSTNGGTASGDGVFTNGTSATVVAEPGAGYAFANWTENGAVVSTSARYTFTNVVNKSLTANFVVNPNPPLETRPAGARSFVVTWPTNYSGFTLQQNFSIGTTNWTNAAETVNVVGGNYQTTIAATNGPRFFRLRHP